MTGRFLLVRHPEVLAKLRSQIASVIPDGQDVTRTHIAKMPYLKCVINESQSLLHILSLSTTAPFSMYLPIP